jgi:hypothetical protein
MTWEEVAEAPSFTGLLNESYGSGAAAAYSVRRLNGLYTGSAIEVERSSDNQTQDIGFDVDGNLDESALTTFCTGTTCKVRTWYDQSVTGGTGSGNDAQQTDHTKQPTIYTGGALVKENGKVAVQFDGSNDVLKTSSVLISGTVGRSMFVTAKADTIGINSIFSLTDNGNATGTLWRFTPEVAIRVIGAQVFDNNPMHVQTLGSVHLAASSNIADISYFENGAQVTATSLGTTDPINTTSLGVSEIGGYQDGASWFYDGNIQEIVMYASDQSSNRTSIESNIGDYFTQNTPLLDTYTGAAAAYSLRKLRTAYTGSAIRVRRASDNTEQDIGFNVFGELDTVSLASFCSGTNGFVVTWYDQSGNANDATQGATSFQPKIYDSSTGVVTENGKPAVDFDGSDDYFDLTGFTVSASDYSAFITNQNSRTNNSWLFDSQSGRFLLDGRTGTAGNGVYYEDTNTWQGTEHSGTGQMLQTIMAISPSSGQSYVNGSQINSGLNYSQTAIGGTVTLGRSYLNNVRIIDGNFQEFILYASDQSSNRTDIEDNINTFYSIY